MSVCIKHKLTRGDGECPVCVREERDRLRDENKKLLQAIRAIGGNDRAGGSVAR